MGAKEDFEKILAPGTPAGRRKRLEADAEAEIACLPKRQQAVLRYLCFHGFSVEGTADALGLSPVSVERAAAMAFSALDHRRKRAAKQESKKGKD